MMMNRFLLVRQEKREMKQGYPVGTEKFSMKFYMTITLPFPEESSENVILNHVNSLGISFIH